MASSGAGYDLNVATFSPDGRLFQVEYAEKAVDNSGTAIGLKCIDGVVLGVEKVLKNKMLVEGSDHRIYTTSKHSGIAITGLASDGRQLINYARAEVENYESFYGSKIPPTLLAERVGKTCHYFSLHGGARPYGVSSLVAAYDPDTKEHELHMVEPSGVTYKYFGCAAGKGRAGGKTEIERLNLSEMTCEEGLKQIAKIIHMLHEAGKDKPFELEMSMLSEKTGWKHVPVSRAVVKECEEWAKKEIEEDEDMDEEEDE